MGIEIYWLAKLDDAVYLDIVSLIPRLEDDFLELFDPLSCARIGICAEVIYTLYSIEVKAFVLFISVIQLSVQNIPKIDASAWEVEILKLEWGM